MIQKPDNAQKQLFEVRSSRRSWLTHAGGGFGGLALAQMLTSQASDKAIPDVRSGGLHHPARAKRVIQLFMNGGVSQIDTFDYKPELERRHGQKIGPKERPEGQTGDVGAVMKSPYRFRQYGQTGRWVSSLFPHQANLVDELAFVMAMQSKTNVHGPGSYMMNTGFTLPGFPCLGAWLSYGLGTENNDLPTFVVLPDARGLPYNHKGNFSAGFLPARHQGTVIPSTGDVAAQAPIPDLFPSARYSNFQGHGSAEGIEILNQLNQRHASDRQEDSRLESRIASYELAARMQLSAPEAFDLSGESPSVQASYGIDEPVTKDFGSRCLLARRLCERGVRFVQVWSGPDGAANNWDNHGSIVTELPPIAASVDKPIAGLLEDLRQRGLLEDTLVVWTTEFGRTPFAQGSVGRDHNGGTFVTWLAGAGVKPGAVHGTSDELGFKAAEDGTWCYDLHATILHLLGIDHQRLIFRTAGIDRRLTDVHGHVLHDILA